MADQAHLTGHWVLRGTIAGKQATHEVDAEWVIQHYYLRLREVSGEKDAKGQPQYEAMIFVGLIDTPKAYTCVWLDIYGGTNITSIGVAAPSDRFFFEGQSSIRRIVVSNNKLFCHSARLFK